MLLGSAATVLARPVQDDDPEVSISVDAAVMNKYIWRGILLTDGAVLQPSLSIGIGGASFNIWGNMDLSDVNGNEYKLNEVDYTGDYTFSLDSLSLSVGFIHYTFPNTDFDSTTELYVGLGLDTVLSPSVTYYQDIDLIEGAYLSIGGGHSVPLGEDYSLDLGAALGWGSEEHNAFYYGAEVSGFTDFLVSASVTIPLNDLISITPTAGYSFLIEEDIRDAFEDPDNPLFGVAISLSF